MATDMKFTPEFLSRVLAAQSTAYTTVTGVQGNVTASADDVKAAIQAVSGNTLSAGFTDWATDFQNIVNALNDLQERVNHYLTTGTGGDDDATAQAKSFTVSTPYA